MLVDFVVTLWDVTHVRYKDLMIVILMKLQLYSIWYTHCKKHYQDFQGEKSQRNVKSHLFYKR